MKSVLFVTYYYPPDAAVGGKRIARFCKYLPEFGIRPTVLTVDLDTCASLDYSFGADDPTEVYRVAPHLTPLGWYARKSFLSKRNSKEERVSNSPVQGEQSSWRGVRFGALGRNIVGCLSIPDLRWGWYLPATRAGVKIVKEERIDAVVSSGPPWTTHAIGHAIAKRCGVPWVADYRDGWNWDSWSHSSVWPSWRKSLDQWLEKRWLRDVSLAICTSKRSNKMLLEMHDHVAPDRVVTITNGFDGLIEPSSLSGSERRPRILLHMGGLYGNRKIDSFCAAVKLLIDSGKLSSDSLRVEFVGEVGGTIKEAAISTCPTLFNDGVLRFLPPVPWHEAQRRMADAQALLIFQGDHSNAIPAKFYEYLLTGKPILSVVQDGALKDICLETNCGVVVDPASEPAVMARAIEEVLNQTQRSAEKIAQVAAPYHFKNLTSQLAEALHRIHGAGSPCASQNLR